MSSFMEAYERIKFATNTRTQVELADVLDIRQSSISDAKRRNSVPADWFMKLFEKFGLNPDWLKQGVGPMYLRTEQGYQPQEGPPGGVAEEPGHYGDPSAKGVMATVYGMDCQYSDEAPAPALQAVGKLSLPLAFAGPGVTVMRMDAPNMEPSIMRGAYVGMDSAATKPISGTVYALYDPHEGVVIKRLFMDSQAGRYLLRSDAQGYPEASLTPEEVSTRMVGRVSWVLQQL